MTPFAWAVLISIAIPAAFLAFLIWQAHPLEAARQRARERAAADAHVAEFKRGRRRYDVTDVHGRPL